MEIFIIFLFRDPPIDGLEICGWYIHQDSNFVLKLELSVKNLSKSITTGIVTRDIFNMKPRPSKKIRDCFGV